MSEYVALCPPLPGVVVTCLVTGSGIPPIRIWGPFDQISIDNRIIALEVVARKFDHHRGPEREMGYRQVGASLKVVWCEVSLLPPR
jgi:hypothetical protein